MRSWFLSSTHSIKLLADENFVNLLRAESLSTMPKYLWDKLGTKHKEAA